MFAHFYHRLLRKYVAIFGTLFNNLYVTRYTTSGAVKEKIKVPLAYGPKEKFLTRLKSDPTLTKSAQIVLPRLSFEITGITYDAERKQQTTIKLQGPPVSNTSVKTTYLGAPYNIDFEMTLYTRNIEDGTQIAEQIMPYFQPDFTVTATLVPEMSLKKDIPIMLNSLNQTIDYEGGMDTTRLITWNFNFTLKGYFYGPSANTDVIKGTAINTGGIVTGNTGGVLVNLYTDTTKQSRQVLTLANTGYGLYREGEVVRTLENDTYGTVLSWSNTATGLELTVSNANKMFDVGDRVVGDTSDAEYPIANTEIPSLVAVEIGIQQTPLSANVINDFGFTTTIDEYPV